MQGEQAVEIFSLVKQQGHLPQKLDDLVPLSFIGSAAVSFYRSKIKLMDQLKMTEAQRKATLHDGQDAGEMLLDIETRIGELINKGRDGNLHTRGKDGRIIHDLPEGITEKRSHQARVIATNPEIVEKVKAQARENEDIPTRTAVINEIRYQREKERQKQSKTQKSEMVTSIEEQQYILGLDRAIMAIPTKPPKNWHDEAFKEAKSKAQIIIKRLEEFK